MSYAYVGFSGRGSWGSLIRVLLEAI
jgi:hypothetical protein